jgi:putative spermidine/putrescine transport system ATP-binding protein
MAVLRGDIELAGLTKSYDGVHTVVQGINLKVPDGAYCCFLGPSGCGKTTILRMIAGHEDPTDGEILIGGENVVGLPPVARGTAMMFQSYALFPHLNVRDNIAFALRIRGLSKADRYRQTDAMIEKVRLSELADRLPAHLSGGQQQRVALARAAITEPRVLLLDEPLSALDEQLRVRMRLELQRMQRDLGITFVHVTHSQLEAIALADMVVVMDRGQIKQAGPARDVYAMPKDRYVAEFLGGQNVFSGRVDAIRGDLVSFAAPQMKHVTVPVGAARVSKGDTIDVAVRRDDVDLIRPNIDLAADTSSLSSRVLAVEYQGNFVKVMLDATGTDEFVAYIPERAFFRDPYTIGDVVQATWPSNLARLLAKTTVLTA